MFLKIFTSCYQSICSTFNVLEQNYKPVNHELQYIIYNLFTFNLTYLKLLLKTLSDIFIRYLKKLNIL